MPERSARGLAAREIADAISLAASCRFVPEHKSVYEQVRISALVHTNQSIVLWPEIYQRPTSNAGPVLPAFTTLKKAGSVLNSNS